MRSFLSRIAFIKDQHMEIKTFFVHVLDAQGAKRERLFTQLKTLLTAHEAAEEKIVHSEARKVIAEGVIEVAARAKEQAAAKNALVVLSKLDAASPEFDTKPRALLKAVLSHAASKESEELVVTKTCELGPCTTDTDCATGMACLITSLGECSEGQAACDAGSVCPTSPPPVCKTITSGICAPEYDFPCQADSDCGSGFTCVAVPCACASSGGGGVGYSNGGGAADAEVLSPVSTDASGVLDGSTPTVVPGEDAGQGVADPVDASCACPDAPVKACSLNSIPCTADSDCVAPWTCLLDNATTCECTGPAMLDGATLQSCDCPEASSSSGSCVPPYWKSASGSSFGSSPSESADAGTAQGVTKGGNDGTPDAGRSVSVDAGLASADDASATQGAPGTGISVSIDAAGADGGGSGASATSNSNDEPKGSSNGGCQIAAGRGASSATGLFAMTLLALGASVLRRRGPSAQRAR